MNTECSKEVSLAHNLLEIMLPRELRTQIIKRMTSQKVEYVQDGTRVQYGSCLYLFVVAWRDSPISKYLNKELGYLSCTCWRIMPAFLYFYRSSRLDGKCFCVDSDTVSCFQGAVEGKKKA